MRLYSVNIAARIASGSSCDYITVSESAYLYLLLCVHIHFVSARVTDTQCLSTFCRMCAEFFGEVSQFSGLV
jgi:hypothetical protein